MPLLASVHARAILGLTASLAVLLSTGGCVETYTTRIVHSATPPQAAVLVTEGLEIRGTGVHAAFNLQPLQPAVPPVVVDATLKRQYSDWDGLASGRVFGSAFQPSAVRDYASFFNRVQHIPVEVYVDGRSKPFYGKMAFFSVLNGTTETLPKRQWRVSVPSEFVRGAEGGIVQTVYQPYSFQNTDYVSWVLSFSSLPF
jgi:hypothetical protein